MSGSNEAAASAENAKKRAKSLSPNERMILEIVRRNGGIKRSSLTPLTNLTQPSVHRIVDALLASGCLVLGDSVIEGRGKPSKELQLNPTAAYSIGISVNTDSASFCICDFRCGIIHSEILDFSPENRLRTLVALKERALNAMKRAEIPRLKLAGVGFAMAGFFVSPNRYFNAPEPLQDWSLVNIEGELAALFETPIWTENNATTGAIGEAVLGAGLEYPTFGYLSFNYGFGAGVVVDGKPIFGAFGNAGEISRIYTLEEGPHRPALGELLKRLQQNGVQVSDVRTLLDTFDPGWPGVEEWIAEVAPHLNRAIDAMWAVIDPAAIIFGGELPRALGELLLKVPPTPRVTRMGAPPEYPQIILSRIEGDPAVIGAAMMPFREQYFS